HTEQPAHIREMVDAYVAEAAPANPYGLDVDVRAFESGRAILNLSKELQVLVLLHVVGRFTGISSTNVLNSLGYWTRLSWNTTRTLRALASSLFRRELPFEREHLLQLLHMTAIGGSSFWWSISPAGLIRAVENFVALHGRSDWLEPALEQLAAALRRGSE